MKEFRMKIALMTIILTLIVLIINSCSSPSEPAYVPEPGRRDYEWTVDTISNPFNILESIWGSSSNDIWAVGPMGDIDKTIFHFNGMKWNCDYLKRDIRPSAVYGINSKDVWICGQGGVIWHYDGNSWKFHAQLKNPLGIDFIVFEDIWGDSHNNIYATGSYPDSTGLFRNGIIAHFNGIKWDIVDIPHVDASLVKIRRCNKENPNYYILGSQVNITTEDSSRIYEFDGNNLKVIYSNTCGTDQWAEIEVMTDKLFFLRGRDICKYINGKFVSYYKINLPNFGNGFMGRHEKDIFLQMTDGIAHYNGSDLKYIYSFNPSISIRGMTYFEKEIVFIAYDFNKSLNLIIIGRLKE